MLHMTFTWTRILGILIYRLSFLPLSINLFSLGIHFHYLLAESSQLNSWPLTTSMTSQSHSTLEPGFMVQDELVNSLNKSYLKAIPWSRQLHHTFHHFQILAFLIPFGQPWSSNPWWITLNPTFKCKCLWPLRSAYFNFSMPGMGLFCRWFHNAKAKPTPFNSCVPKARALAKGE